MRKYILIALLLIFFVAFAWSIWLVNKPEDRVEAYSLVFAEGLLLVNMKNHPEYTIYFFALIHRLHHIDVATYFQVH
jgi:hypothetical protein